MIDVDPVLRCTPSEMAQLKPLLADMRRKFAVLKVGSEVGREGLDSGRVIDVLKFVHQEIAIPRIRPQGSVPPTAEQLLDKATRMADKAYAVTGTSSKLDGFYAGVYANHASHALALGTLAGMDLSKALREDGNPYVEVCMARDGLPVFHLHETVDGEEETTRIPCDTRILEKVAGPMPMCCYVTTARTNGDRSTYAHSRMSFASVIDEDDGIIIPVPELDPVAMLRLASAMNGGTVTQRSAT